MKVQVSVGLVIGLVALFGCTRLVEEAPVTGSVASGPAAPIPVVVAAPQASSPQDPTPTPTPAPTATPTGTCVPGTGSGQNCRRSTPSFLADVDAAINTLAQREPGLFNFGDQRGAGGWLVLDPERYHRGVAAILIERGLCAIYDGEELGVKRNNDFSDQYDIHLSTGHVRRGEGSYRATCSPAWF